jgi:hypothetical protein
MRSGDKFEIPGNHLEMFNALRGCISAENPNFYVIYSEKGVTAYRVSEVVKIEAI